MTQADELGSIQETRVDPGKQSTRRRWGKARWALIIALALMLLLGGGLALAAYTVSERLAGQVERIPAVFDDLDEETRPEKPQVEIQGAAESLTFLLAGVDTRDGFTPSLTEGLTGERTDTIMLVHISSDRDSAILVSIPRDSWVDVPGHGMAKINAAYSWGGYPLFIETVEQLTALRIDHLAIIGFDGLRDITEALGGVEMTFAEPAEGHSGAVFSGDVVLDGDQALDYVRARYNLPRGDFDRVQRQQNLLRALMHQTLTSGNLTNPIKLTNVLDALTKNLAVDDALTTGAMRGLALELRDLRASNVTFLTAPVAGVGTEGQQSVVFLDEARVDALFEAIRDDEMASYLDDHPETDMLGEHTR